MSDVRVGVVGAGAWGTAIAQLLAGKGSPVDLWVFEEDLARAIMETRENTLYMPGFRLDGRITPRRDLASVVSNHDLVVMVVPSHVYRGVAERALPHLDSRTLLVSATKGIENETLLTMAGIWEDISGGRVRAACLSGPSFAKEVMRGVPTAVVAAAQTLETAQAVQKVFHTPRFRVYTSTDVVGVELAGALKNVIALAAGASDGLGYGHNSRAALITRGLAEISRLGVRMGAHPLTFAGLSGIGDIILTCTGDLSRNRTLGFRLGRGETLEAIIASMHGAVAEGVKTARSAYFLAQKLGVDMPLCEQVYKVLHEGKSPTEAVRELTERDMKHELEHFCD